MKLDIENYLPDNILSLTDKSTMAASVEESPFSRSSFS